MSDFNDTAQRIAPRLDLPKSQVPGPGHRREPVAEPREHAWVWARFAAAGIVIAWLLSTGTQ
jgi:hypothetical protein